MKLVVLGGGGVRALMLAKTLSIESEKLGINHLVFMDIDKDKLDIFAGMANQVVKKLKANINFEYTTNAKEALKDADFVITTIRVGGEKSRVVDERIAINNGLIGQETTGVGGFSMAVRSIPVLKEYCELIKEVSKPNVMVFNFTNPAGVVTQAMHDYGYDFVYGICDAPSGFIRQLVKLNNADKDDLTMDVFGLNHLSFFSNILLEGKDITEELISNPKLYTETDMRYFEPDIVEHMGMLLNEYLYYFYYREKAENNLAHTEKTRGEDILEINIEMTKALKNLDPENDFDEMLKIYSEFNFKRESSYMATETSVKRNKEVVPIYDIYTPDDGGYAGVALAFIKAKLLKEESEMVLCMPNEGTVDWLEKDDIVETSCYIGPDGAKAKPLTFEISEPNKELIKSVKCYERNAAKAIINGDRKLAINALMVHPLINSYSLAVKLFDEYAEQQKDFFNIFNE